MFHALLETLCASREFLEALARKCQKMITNQKLFAEAWTAFMLVFFLADRWSYIVRMLTMFAVFALESRRTNTLSHKLVTYSPIVTDWTVLGTCTTPDQGLTLWRKKKNNYYYRESRGCFFSWCFRFPVSWKIMPSYTYDVVFFEYFWWSN